MTQENSPTQPARHTLVMGLQWGDEGKGKIVDCLTQDAHAVVRFQGGHNAGHTLIIDGKKTILRLIPSGIMHAHMACFIGGGVVLSPSAFFAEIDELQTQNLSVEARIRVAENTHLLLPYHVAIDQAREAAAKIDNKIGTTGRGIGPCYEDKVARRGVRVHDLMDEASFIEKVTRNTHYHNQILQHIYQQQPLTLDAVLAAVMPHRARLLAMMCDVPNALDALIKQNKRVIFEGAQGALLDIDHGTYPFVTSSNSVAGNICAGAGVGIKPYVLGVTKSYCTRVGAGPFPSELYDANHPQKQSPIGLHIATVGKEFGSVTGRPRRTGWLDIPILRKSIQVNGVDGIILTKLDVLDELPEIQLCVAYEYQGQHYDISPQNTHILAHCTPIYERFEGWQTSTFGVQSLQELPLQARAYIERIQALLNTRLDIISTGPDRAHTIMLNDSLYTQRDSAASSV